MILSITSPAKELVAVNVTTADKAKVANVFNFIKSPLVVCDYLTSLVSVSANLNNLSNLLKS